MWAFYSFSNLAEIREFLTFNFVSSIILTNGSLTASSHNPRSFAAYLTGAGLLSINNALWTGWSIVSIFSASSNSLAFFDLEKSGEVIEELEIENEMLRQKLEMYNVPN